MCVLSNLRCEMKEFFLFLSKDICILFGFVNIFVVLKWSLSSFSSLQFPGDDSEEQVMCVAMLVCE